MIAQRALRRSIKSPDNVCVVSESQYPRLIEIVFQERLWPENAGGLVRPGVFAVASQAMDEDDAIARSLLTFAWLKRSGARVLS